MSDKVKVLIVDDHAVVRAGLRHILTEAHDIEVAAEADTVSEAWTAVSQHAIDVVLLDLTLRAESGMDLVKRAKAKELPLRILILSAFGEDQYAVQALKAGADGYLNKDSAPELLIAAVRRVATGKKYISDNLLGDKTKYWVVDLTQCCGGLSCALKGLLILFLNSYLKQ